MSDDTGPLVTWLEEDPDAPQHPYADHPAALILADHYISRPNPIRTPTAPIGCACGWTGPACDHPAHLTDMLQQAGLLADGTPPETPTERVLAERADRRTT